MCYLLHMRPLLYQSCDQLSYIFLFFSLHENFSGKNGQITFVTVLTMGPLLFQTPCMSSPCQNGRICWPNYKYRTFDCRCREGFIGEYCEIGELSLIIFFIEAVENRCL